jgi:ribulose kinase
MMKKKPTLVIGIDAGTQTLRAGVFTTDGELIKSVTRNYGFTQPYYGWAEQNSLEVLEALIDAIKECTLSAEVTSRGKIGAISIVGTTVSLVACDSSNELLMPVILWMDTRSTSEADYLESIGSEWLKYTGNKLSPEWMLAKALWISRNKPEIFRQIKHFSELSDWLDFKLTGNWTASLTTLSAEWTYCSDLGGWPTDLLTQCGLDDLISKVPLMILPPGGIVGPLQPSIAKDLGLPTDVVVTKGLMDSYASALSLGVLDRKRITVSIGTSSAYIATSDIPKFDKGLVGTVPDAFGRGVWALQGGQTSAGAIIQWFIDQLGEQTNYQELDILAQGIPPGSNGLVALDCWQGSRSPYRDPLARGALLGLNLKHTKAHVYKALLESVAYGGRQILEIIKSTGISPDGLWICGGGTRSNLLMQIHADVLGLPLYISPFPDMAMVGAAVCALVGTGLRSNLLVSSMSISRVGRTVTPNIKAHEKYTPYYEEYCQSYPLLNMTMHRLANLA